MDPATAFRLIWLAWAISWALAAFWSAPTVKHLPGRAQSIYRVGVVVGALLLFSGTAVLLGVRRLWFVGLTGAWMLVGVTALGLLFAWWARLHLGKLWSGTITRKEDHRVIDTGPYGIVRHPIYSGALLSVVATAVAKATVSAILGAGLMIFSFWYKARAEERFLTSELGASYADYRRLIPMLIPFGPRTR